MANTYYTFTPVFTEGTKVRAGAVNTQYQALETAFDKLPASDTALTTGKATFAPESGTGNAYKVVMPNTRTVNANGDEVIFFATHVNTGAATMQVDAIGAVAMTDRTGAALASGAITSGRLYVATYDSANTRFVLDVAINTVTNVIDKVQGTSTDNPAAPGTFDANLGYENASSVSLATVGFNSDIDFTIKNAVTGGKVIAEYGGKKRIATSATTGILGGVIVYSDGNTDTERRAIEFAHQDGTQRGLIGYLGGSALHIENRVTLGSIEVSANPIGSKRTALHFDPAGGPGSDGQLILYGEANNSMVKTLSAATGGLEVNNLQTGSGFERVLTQSDTARTSTTAALAAIGNAINTAAEKVAGFMVFNTTTSKPVWASGNADGSVWVDATGATVHTPV